MKACTIRSVNYDMENPNLAVYSMSKGGTVHFGSGIAALFAIT